MPADVARRLGLAAARTSAGLAGHTAVAIGGYMLGVATGSRVIALAPRRRETGQRAARPEGWPATVTAALVLELVLLAAFAAGWELTGPHPAGASQYLLLVALAAGALINGILVAHAPAAVPAVIIMPLCVVLALRTATRRRTAR